MRCGSPCESAPGSRPSHRRVAAIASGVCMQLRRSTILAETAGSNFGHNIASVRQASNPLRIGASRPSIRVLCLRQHGQGLGPLAFPVARLVPLYHPESASPRWPRSKLHHSLSGPARSPSLAALPARFSTAFSPSLA